MPIKFQKRILKYLKNMKTCAPTGAAGIGCKWYRVQLVIGSTGFHPKGPQNNLVTIENKVTRVEVGRWAGTRRTLLSTNKFTDKKIDYFVHL